MRNFNVPIMKDSVIARNEAISNYKYKMKRGGAVYIMGSSKNTNNRHCEGGTTEAISILTHIAKDCFTSFAMTGVIFRTPQKRVYEHKNKLHPDSFTAKYQLNKLIYYEKFHRIEEAIGREKQIKGGSRKNKMEIINAFNPEWKDLYEEVMQW